MTTPTTPPLTCEQFADRLADLLESDTDAASRSAIEAHALRCAECGALLADLRRLRIDAANLPALAPSRDLWTGIAARIETPVVELAPGGRVAGRAVERGGGAPRRRLSPMWIGLAAAGLVAITATVTHEITKRTVVTTTPVQVAVTPVVASPRPDTSIRGPVASLVANKPTAEQTYDAEIARLRAVVAQRRSVLDTATVGVIERNLRVIDTAIAQCRQALRADPASRFLMESLNDALDTKVQLLRIAAMLPSRS